MTFTHYDEFGKSEELTTTNDLGLKKIITLCPMKSIAGDFDGLAGLGVEAIAKSFTKQRIEWLNVGRIVVDDASGWLPLVHDCTYPQSMEAQKELDMNSGMQLDVFRALSTTKTNTITDQKATTWFEPVFAAIDAAILNAPPPLFIAKLASLAARPF